MHLLKILSFLTWQILTFKSGKIPLRKKLEDKRHSKILIETRAQAQRNVCSKEKERERVTIIVPNKTTLTQ